MEILPKSHLGLDDMNADENNKISESEDIMNIMVQGVRERTELGNCDKYVYYKRHN